MLGGTKEVEPLGEFFLKTESKVDHLDEVVLEGLIVGFGQLAGTPETEKFDWLGFGEVVYEVDDAGIDDDITFFIFGVIFGVDVVDARYRFVVIDRAEDGNFVEQLFHYLSEMIGKPLRIFDVDGFRLMFFDKTELLSQGHLSCSKKMKKVIECT